MPSSHKKKCPARKKCCHKKFPRLQCEIVCKPDPICCTAVAETPTDGILINLSTPSGAVVKPDLSNVIIGTMVNIVGVEKVCNGVVVVGGQIVKTFTIETPSGPVLVPTPIATGPVLLNFQCVIHDPSAKCDDIYQALTKDAKFCHVYSSLELSTLETRPLPNPILKSKDLITICVQKVLHHGNKPFIESISPTTLVLPPNNPPTITIRGTDLYPALIGGVKFGGVTAVIDTICPPDLIIAEIPLIAGTGGTPVQVTVTNVNGKVSNSVPFTFTGE